MGRREIRLAKWAKENPEYLRLIEEERVKFETGCKIAEIRTNAGLSRSQFAALLKVSLEKVDLLESGNLWASEESTLKWVRESLGV